MIAISPSTAAARSTAMPAAADTPLLQVSGVHRTLSHGQEPVAALRGVSFHVRRGEWVALTGPSGSGKSTLLGILAGLDTPDGGSVLLDGVDIARLPERDLARVRNRQIGVVFQSFNLIPTLTALENVEAPLHVTRARDSRRRAATMLELVGLSDRIHHRPHQLSGGQQQRVAIARALVTQPSLLAADEPTGSLDRHTGETILDLFSQVRRETGVTLVVATHDPHAAARAGRTLHLVDGRLAPSPNPTGVPTLPAN